MVNLLSACSTMPSARSSQRRFHQLWGSCKPSSCAVPWHPSCTADSLQKTAQGADPAALGRLQGGTVGFSLLASWRHGQLLCIAVLLLWIVVVPLLAVCPVALGPICLVVASHLVLAAPAALRGTYPAVNAMARCTMHIGADVAAAAVLASTMRRIFFLSGSCLFRSWLRRPVTDRVGSYRQKRQEVRPVRRMGHQCSGFVGRTTCLPSVPPPSERPCVCGPRAILNPRGSEVANWARTVVHRGLDVALWAAERGKRGGSQMVCHGVMQGFERVQSEAKRTGSWRGRLRTTREDDTREDTRSRAGAERVWAARGAQEKS